MIRANGTIEKLEHPIGLPGAYKAIKATGLDTVLLYDRTHVMLVDDNGIDKRPQPMQMI